MEKTEIAWNNFNFLGWIEINVEGDIVKDEN